MIGLCFCDIASEALELFHAPSRFALLGTVFRSKMCCTFQATSIDSLPLAFRGLGELFLPHCYSASPLIMMKFLRVVIRVLWASATTAGYVVAATLVVFVRREW